MKRVCEDVNSTDMALENHYNVISTMEREETSSSLCCCEYRNVYGQRTHLLAFCCDCEDLDNAVDQCIKGNRVSNEKISAISEVIADRVRIPWPTGAKRVEIGAVLPVVILPVSLYLASHGLVFTVLSMVYVPVIVVCYYIYALRQRKKTWFFVSWGYVSVVGLYGLFMYYVAPMCSLLNILGLSLGFGAMIVCYTRVVFSKAWLQQFSSAPSNSSPLGDHGREKGLQRLSCCFCTFGPFQRAKHCRTCGYCVPKSDHHCVWTNCCIGQHNHRHFLLAICLFVVIGSWGILLCLMTVCQSRDVDNLHLDCSDVYSQASSAFVFVASFYGVMFTISMSSLLMQQLLFVSFNITTDEWKRTIKKKKTFWQALHTSPYNKGFLKNWIEFLFCQGGHHEKANEII